jgi:hypothetical protein
MNEFANNFVFCVFLLGFGKESLDVRSSRGSGGAQGEDCGVDGAYWNT